LVIVPLKTTFTAEAQRTGRDIFFFDPIVPARRSAAFRHAGVRGDWITKVSPSGIDSDCTRPFIDFKRGEFYRKKAFYLAASQRQIKKMISWRPLRLCGENPNLDKSDAGS
jgi:hypothetical protein